MVGVHRLVREIVLPTGLPGALHVTRLRVCPAYPLLRLPPVFLDLLCPGLAPPPRPALQLRQPLLLAGVQPLPVHPGLLCQLHLLLRGPGGVGLHMGGVCPHQPPAGQPLGDALPHDLLKQPTKYLAEGRLPPPQLADRAVVRHPFKQIQSQIPPQGHVRLDALLDLPL